MPRLKPSGTGTEALTKKLPTPWPTVLASTYVPGDFGVYSRRIVLYLSILPPTVSLAIDEITRRNGVLALPPERILRPV
jgi:hypothetical protein